MTSPSVRFYARLAAVVVGVALVRGLIFRAPPSLDGLDRLLAAGQYAAAERQLLDYLRYDPGDEAARILLARASVDRPDPKPDFALEQLEGLEPASKAQAAKVRSIRGKAYFHKLRYDRAEIAWLDALRLDPAIAEVGWGLLNLYAMQSRFDESRQLGLRLYAHEPDPHDRRQLLLQMIRFDAHAVEIGSLVHQLEPVVTAHPDEIFSSLALGTVLVHVGRSAEGLDLLRKVVEQHQGRPEPWIDLAEAFVETGQPDELAKLIAQMPPEAAKSPRIVSTQGWLAMQRQDWPRAVEILLDMFARRPFDPAIANRLRISLRHAGRAEDLARLGPRLQAAIGLAEQIRPLYDRIDAATSASGSGMASTDSGDLPGDYHRVATALRQVGRTEEADLWDRQAADLGTAAR